MYNRVDRKRHLSDGFSVCWLCSAIRNTTSSTASDSSSCSPRWIVHLDLRTSGAWPMPTWFGTKQQNCLDFCVRNTTCVSAEWSVEHGCWIHFKRRERSAQPGVTQFEIANRCNTTSGKRTCSSDWITGLQLRVIATFDGFNADNYSFVLFSTGWRFGG